MTSDTRNRIKVLVESDSPALRVADFRHYRDAGLDVALCSGPESDDETCPLVAGLECPHAAGADVVLFGLDRVAPRSREILEQIKARHPSSAVVVETPRRAAGDVPDGCTVLPFPSSIDEQVRVLRRAASTRRGRRL